MSVPGKLWMPMHRPHAAPAPAQARAPDAGPGRTQAAYFLDKYGLIRDGGDGRGVCGAVDYVSLTRGLPLVLWGADEAHWHPESQYARCPVTAIDLPILDKGRASHFFCRTLLASRCVQLLRSVDGLADYLIGLAGSHVAHIPPAACGNLLVDSARGLTHVRVEYIYFGSITNP